MSQQWQERLRPVRLERRYRFESYDAVRDFLDRAAEISQREGLYPDIGFGRDYVNMTIHADEDSGSLQERQRRFAELVDEIAAPGAST